jgi:hypothetical protein
MTKYAVEVLPDGRHLYRNNRVKYMPVKPEDRKYKVRKPDDPRAVRFRGEWFIPYDTVPDDQRTMPETQPDNLAYLHIYIRNDCDCTVCVRPEAQVWRTMAREAKRNGKPFKASTTPKNPSKSHLYSRPLRDACTADESTPDPAP